MKTRRYRGKPKRYDVTIPIKPAVNQWSHEIIFTTSSKTTALSCAQTLMENAAISAKVWIGARLYAGFFTEDYFE